MATCLVVFAIVLLTPFLHVQETHASCGIRPQKRVIGGEEASPHSWPWQAHILVKKGNNFEHQCGGSLINKQWVVTAAHCLFSETDPTKYKVILGDFDRSIVEATEQEFEVAAMHLHSHWFTNKDYGFDMGLIKLSRNASFTSAVSPVCLPRQGDAVAVGKVCYLTGWGVTNIIDPKPDTLQQVAMPIVSTKKCKEGNSILTYSIVDRNTMVCAGFGGTSVVSGCNGDSGGPLVCEEEGRWVLHGVVSWGHWACAAGETYSVFARVSSFINWITTTMTSKEKPPNYGNIVCKDRKIWCKKWKEDGYCSNSWFKGRMKLDCGKTCGFCSNKP